MQSEVDKNLDSVDDETASSLLLLCRSENETEYESNDIDNGKVVSTFVESEATNETKLSVTSSSSSSASALLINNTFATTSTINNNPTKKRKVSLSPNVNELKKYFHLPIQAVSKELGICATILKKLCRKNKIMKWPYRQIKSLTCAIQSLEMAMLNQSITDNDKVAMKAQVQSLQATIDSIFADPSVLNNVADDVNDSTFGMTSTSSNSSVNRAKLSGIHSSGNDVHVTNIDEVVNGTSTRSASNSLTQQQQSEPTHDNIIISIPDSKIMDCVNAKMSEEASMSDIELIEFVGNDDVNNTDTVEDDGEKPVISTCTTTDKTHEYTTTYENNNSTVHSISSSSSPPTDRNAGTENVTITNIIASPPLPPQQPIIMNLGSVIVEETYWREDDGKVRTLFTSPVILSELVRKQFRSLVKQQKVAVPLLEPEICNDFYISFIPYSIITNATTTTVTNNDEISS